MCWLHAGIQFGVDEECPLFSEALLKEILVSILRELASVYGGWPDFHCRVSIGNVPPGEGCFYIAQNHLLGQMYINIPYIVRYLGNRSKYTVLPRQQLCDCLYKTGRVYIVFVAAIIFLWFNENST